MRKKRAQITAFILIAIILLFIISATIYFGFSFRMQKIEGGAKKVAKAAHRQTVIKNMVSPMLEQDFSFELKTTPNLNTVIIGDVTYTTTEDILSGTNIPYFESFPDLKTIEKRTAEYIRNYLIQNPLELPEGYEDCEVDASNAKVNTRILDNKLRISVDNYVVVCSDTRFSLQHTITVDSRIKTMHSAANEIGNQYRQDPTSVDLTSLSDISKRDDLKITVIPYDDQTIVYMITDRLEEHPLSISFATKV